MIAKKLGRVVLFIQYGLSDYLVLQTRVYAHSLSRYDHIHRFMNSQKSLWYKRVDQSLTYSRTPDAHG
jgi:response regulator of citrate/malate metabolism